MHCLKQLFLLIFILGITLSADLRGCDSQKECNSNECCLTNNPPRGRRLISDSHLGHCVSLGQIGDPCYVRYGSASTPPADVTFGCPCMSPLHCIGSHMAVMPLGEIGTCG